IVMFYDYGNAKTSAWTLINNNDTYSTKESWVAPSFDANAITGRVASTRYKGKQKDKIIAMYDYGNYKPAAMSWEQSSGNNLVAKRELDFGSYDATRITGRFVIGKFDGSTTRVAAMYDGTYVNPNLDERQKIITYAEQFLGRPYVWGGHGPDSFDCAGFTAYVFSHFGYGVSGNTYEQINQGTPISFNELQPGDLVFERGTASRPEHVGIYYGKGQIIHAANPRDGVKIGPISDYVAARRIIK
ncbi:Cell wall-associated hydrolase, NlpC family, partial [Clostridium cavendishii DSM 21758]